MSLNLLCAIRLPQHIQGIEQKDRQCIYEKIYLSIYLSIYNINHIYTHIVFIYRLLWEALLVISYSDISFLCQAITLMCLKLSANFQSFLYMIHSFVYYFKYHIISVQNEYIKMLNILVQMKMKSSQKFFKCLSIQKFNTQILIIYQFLWYSGENNILNELRRLRLISFAYGSILKRYFEVYELDPLAVLIFQLSLKVPPRKENHVSGIQRQQQESFVNYILKKCICFFFNVIEILILTAKLKSDVKFLQCQRNYD